MSELSYRNCCFKNNLDFLNFENTNDLSFEDKSFVLQKKATEAIKIGLQLNRYGYNIYCSGNTSTYKKHFLNELIPKISNSSETPEDMCYVFNPKNKFEPILLKLSAGKGSELRDHVDKIISEINIELSNFFQTTAYKKEIEKILQSAEAEMLQLHDEYAEKIEKYGFTLIEDAESNSLYPAPIKKGKVLTQEEFDGLPEKEKEKYIENKRKIDLHLLVELYDKEEEVAQKQKDNISSLDYSNAKNIIRRNFSDFSLKYATNIEVIKYKENIVDDILHNLDLFKMKDSAEEEDKIETVEIEGLEIKTSYKKKTELFKKYKVNLIVDNSKLKGKPIIFVDDYIEDEELFGCCKYQVSSSNISSDFSQIMGGEILKANGGYLIIDINSLFHGEDTWEKLKSVLKNHKVKIQTKYYNDVIVADTIKPKPIDIDIKVILLGSFELYSYLKKIDPDFNELFRMHAIFEEEVTLNNESILSYIYDICYYINKENLLPFTKDGLQEILRYSSRQAESQKRLSLDNVRMYSLLDEADIFARKNGKEMVDAQCVNDCYKERLSRINFFDEYYKDMIKEKIYLFNVTGEKIGIVNGLSVSDYIDFSIGQPIRITCNTYKGQDGIISVDRTAELTGPIHDKAIEIIKGCIGSYLAKKYPLSININLSFEQLYNGLEGDSATCAEMVSIFSDLFEIPVKQNLAITGSMNQKGEVQAIGGVNEKIEGFFNVCTVLGRNDNQGVVIPESNVKDLMLSEEVVEAIKNKTFHIYTVNTLEEVLEKMLGIDNNKLKEEILKFEEKRKEEED